MTVCPALVIWLEINPASSVSQSRLAVLEPVTVSRPIVDMSSATAASTPVRANTLAAVFTVDGEKGKFCLFATPANTVCTAPGGIDFDGNKCSCGNDIID